METPQRVAQRLCAHVATLPRIRTLEYLRLEIATFSFAPTRFRLQRRSPTFCKYLVEPVTAFEGKTPNYDLGTYGSLEQQNEGVEVYKTAVSCETNCKAAERNSHVFTLGKWKKRQE